MYRLDDTTKQPIKVDIYDKAQVAGWHVVVEDYPSYAIHFLAKTFEEAEIEIKANWMDE